FKPGYPRLDQLKAQVEETRRRLQRETQKVVGGIESAYRASETKEKGLRAKMEKQKAMALSLKDASVEYAILAREVDTNRQLYDSVLQRMKEMGVAAELRASNVSVIDKAEPPPWPSKPQKALSLLLSLLLGLTGGVGLAFFFEYLDNTLKTPEEVERYLRLPNLGVVPDFLSLDQRSYAPKLSYTQFQLPNPPSSKEEIILYHHPFSLVTESYRTLRTAILLSRAGEPPKTLLFTSGTRGEGKTVTVVNTAIVFAQMGARVLVVDADLRRPGCHKILGMENGLGLTELLTGQREPEEVIQPTAAPHLYFLSSGSIPPNPAELLGSKKMRETLAFLQERYDYILIDSSPVMPVSDAVLLSTMVDGVVLVANSQETPKHVVREACSRLSYARAKILGVVLNHVDMKNGDYVYYYHDHNYPRIGV
ncbi:MAG: polysaccharide biosynthesis tyrosine autokinase, partial [Candidatus Tectomicrobia bacterium]|nr:polysaccharide biosynthesis tyrosine autokinase [Candidatus Tectomicrobia bacterium]